MKSLVFMMIIAAATVYVNANAFDLPENVYRTPGQIALLKSQDPNLKRTYTTLCKELKIKKESCTEATWGHKNIYTGE